MKNLDIPMIIMQLIIILIFVIILVQVLIFRHAVKLEKRIASYGIDPINNNTSSVFDKLSKLYYRFIKKISKILNHSNVLKNISKRYNKYLVYIEKDNFKQMDFISVKITFTITLFLIALLYNVIKMRNFSIIQIVTIIFLGFVALDIILFIKVRLRKKKINDDVLKAIIIMNSAFKSGRTTMQAIEIVKNELDGPIGEEFNKMYTDIKFGLSLDVVFERFSKRIDSDDVRYITSSLTVLNKTGGDIVKVFNNVEKSFFERRKLRNELKTLTSSADIMFKVLVCAPVILSLIIYFLNPSYFNILFTTKVGLIITFLIIIIYSLYIFFVRKIMKIEV